MKLLVLSIDAMFSEDVEKLKKYARIAPFFERALVAKNMAPIYPALTYPCHVSIVSGNRPEIHGVYHNLECVPNAKFQDWKWYYSDVHCPTLFDYFRQEGYSTSAIFWPVSANAPVNFLVPEIWSYTDDPVNIIKATSGGAVDHIIERHREDVDFTSKFRLDRFAKDCALDIVDEFDPDVMFLHLSLVDSTRHGYGIRHEKVEEAFDQCALWLEEVLEHISRKTDLSELSLVVLGDHGHLNCRGSLSMNKLFADRGWVDVPFPEKRSDCRAFTHAAGVSAQVYVNDPTIRCEAEALFEELKQQGWLTNWFTKEAAAAHGLAGPFDYVLEAGEGYFFADAVKPAFFTQSWAKDGGEFIGKHGHFPARGDMPPFVLSHPGLESKETCDHSILDIAPTIAKVFRLPAEAMQGSSLL